MVFVVPIPCCSEEEPQLKKPRKPRKPRKPKPLSGPHVVYLEDEGYLTKRGQWSPNVQEAEIKNSSASAKSHARKIFKYRNPPITVSIVPVIVWDSPDRAQTYLVGKV